jgi:hypothetical protein
MGFSRFSSSLRLCASAVYPSDFFLHRRDAEAQSWQQGVGIEDRELKIDHLQLPAWSDFATGTPRIV